MSQKQQQQKFDFPIAGVLTRIFSFGVPDENGPAEAVLRLGLVNKNWRETLKYASEMWERLSKRQQTGWPEVHGQNFSLHSFKRRRMRTRYAANPENEENMDEIENCGSIEFKFRCPLLLSELVLTGEVEENGLATLFCNVCEKKVHPVTNRKELKKQAGQGRCVVISQQAGRESQKAAFYLKNLNARREALDKLLLASESSSSSPSSSSSAASAATSSSASAAGGGGLTSRQRAPKKIPWEEDDEMTISVCSYTHVAVVTDEPAPAPGSSDHDAAQDLLVRLHSRGRDYFDTANLLTSELLHLDAAESSANVIFHVVRLPPQNSSSSSSSSKKHPAEKGGVFCREAMPSNGGWAHIVCMTKSVEPVFEEKNIPVTDSTAPLRAVLTAGRIHYRPTVEKSSSAPPATLPSSFSSSNIAVKTEEEAQVRLLDRIDDRILSDKFAPPQQWMGMIAAMPPGGINPSDDDDDESDDEDN